MGESDEPGSTTREVRFVGGPLDGRDQRLPASEAISGRLLRHVHLHEGPKIETHYRLDYSPESGWRYRLCPNRP